MTDIRNAAQEICNAGAIALRRYIEISGEDPLDDMPEHFLQAFIMDRLGGEITITIETGLSKLSRWNDDSRKRQGREPLTDEEKKKLASLGKDLGLPRIDMVLFNEENQNQKKEEQGLLALVEFKKSAWAMELDRAKLLRILPFVSGCEYGIVCGACKDADLSFYKLKSDAASDEWFQSPLTDLDDRGTRYYFCARLFTRSAPDAVNLSGG